MKQFVKLCMPAIILLVASFSGLAKAAGGPYVKPLPINVLSFAERSFSIGCNLQPNDGIVCIRIENPGRKNLSLTLHGPDGNILDNFFTGRKFIKMSKDYNFSGAEEGVYSIVISDGKTKIKKQVKLERIMPASSNRLEIQ
ncbi:MAG: hypothetical protein ABIQ88_03490 [Chitinophagaceae bacterium]